jgi:hypothetical protein
LVQVVKDIHKDSHFRDKKARAVRRKKVKRLDQYDLDLAEQLKSPQRAFAQERGESNRFREEVRILLRQAL